jgi:rare lipoprotein A
MKSIIFVILSGITAASNADQVGVASYYGGKFHGRKMANGELFNKYKISAAHRSIPLGSVVKITNLKNKISITCKIADRGPYVRGRILDLSLAARNALRFDGLTKVSIRVVKKPT